MQKIIEELKKENDVYLRFYLSDKIHKILQKSHRGEIGIADFNEELQNILNESKKIINICKK